MSVMLNGKPFTWSYSTLNSFETCPWRWKLVKVTKQVQEEPYDHRSEGNIAHKALEMAVVNRAMLPAHLRQFTPLVERIRVSQGTVEAERKIALTEQFTETGYYASDVWLRAVFDIRVVLPDKTVVIDWKMGKRKLDADQLRLFAAVEFKVRPNVDTVQTGYAWLKEGKIDRETFTRDQVPELWQEFSTRVARIEHAIKTDNFPKRPSGLCRKYCPVGNRNCEHCGE
jgi:hypothetical protein